MCRRVPGLCGIDSNTAGVLVCNIIPISTQPESDLCLSGLTLPQSAAPSEAQRLSLQTSWPCISLALPFLAYGTLGAASGPWRLPFPLAKKPFSDLSASLCIQVSALQLLPLRAHLGARPLPASCLCFSKKQPVYFSAAGQNIIFTKEGTALSLFSCI